MLRITRVEGSPGTATLKVEGRIAADWVRVLREEMRRSLEEKQAVVLDFADVRFVDRQGVEMLRQMRAAEVRIVNCPPLIGELLAEAEAG